MVDQDISDDDIAHCHTMLTGHQWISVVTVVTPETDLTPDQLDNNMI